MLLLFLLLRRSPPAMQLGSWRGWPTWQTWNLTLIFFILLLTRRIFILLLLLLLHLQWIMRRTIQLHLRMVRSAHLLLLLSMKRREETVGIGVANREAAIGVAGGVAHRDVANMAANFSILRMLRLRLLLFFPPRLLTLLPLLR